MGGGGGGGKMTTIFLPIGLRQGVMVKWSNTFYRDHGQNFKITVVRGQMVKIGHF